ncbi:hypothetical protein HQ587_05225 [bacterium]|nr:hypothetical protein [bacterium]
MNLSSNVFRRSTVLLILFSFSSLISASHVFAYEPVNKENSASDTVDTVKRVIDLYNSGNISDAEHLALKYLENPDGLTKLDRFMLYKVLAFCAVANDDEGGAIRRFVEALKLNPSLLPNPITWSPKVRRVFSLAVDVYDSQTRRKQLSRQKREADICRRASMRSLYLPGSGQIFKGHKRKGLVLRIMFWGAAATFVYSQAVLPSAHDDYLNSMNRIEATDRWMKYRDAYRLSYISGGIAVTTYLYAFLDALYKKPVVNSEIQPESIPITEPQ